MLCVAEVVVHCAFEVCRVLYLSGCAQLCTFVFYLFRCACYVELRALQRWSAAISPRAGFRRQRHRFYLAALRHSAAVCPVPVHFVELHLVVCI